jgi:hypothetical protein
MSPRSLLTVLRRWQAQQESALGQFGRKTISQRLAGYGKSERVEAKFFLLALLPFAPVMLSDELGWQRTSAWYIWFWISAAWAAFVFSYMIWGLFRAFMRSLKRSK